MSNPVRPFNERCSYEKSFLCHKAFDGFGADEDHLLDSVTVTTAKDPSPTVSKMSRSISPEEVQSNAVIRNRFAKRDTPENARLMARIQQIAVGPRPPREKSPLSQMETLVEERDVRCYSRPASSPGEPSPLFLDDKGEGKGLCSSQPKSPSRTPSPLNLDNS